MEFKIKKITYGIISLLEFEYHKQKLIKLVIAVLLSALLLNHETWQDAVVQGVLLGLCTTDLKKIKINEEVKKYENNR